MLVNTSISVKEPTLIRGEKTDYGMSKGYTGGGDWNNDGIEDLVVSKSKFAENWIVYPGSVTKNGKHIFIKTPSLIMGKKSQYRMINYDEYPESNWRKRSYVKWFDSTPYAWNFSGRYPRGSRTTEIVAAKSNPSNAARGKEKGRYKKFITDINFYEVNHDTKECVFKGTLDRANSYMTRLSIGDLNADGSMDILYAGGMFDGGVNSQIWVMYGKVPNIPEKTTYRRWFVSELKQ